MRTLWVAALITAPAGAGGSELTGVDVSFGDVSINKVPQLVAADQGLSAKYGLNVHQVDAVLGRAMVIARVAGRVQGHR